MSAAPTIGSARSASTITVPEALALLDGAFADLGTGVANGQYAFWLGSGISRGRVDDLPSVVQRALEHVAAKSPTTPEYEVALGEAIGLAELPAADLRLIDLKKPTTTWPPDLLGTIRHRLVGRYSELLDIRIAGKEPDYMLWDAVGLPRLFGVPGLPDCEHLCLGILAIEGVAPEIASPNWDGLIETAIEHLGWTNGILTVCVSADDVQGPRRRARLLKFHGCAIRATHDPTRYRALLIASKSQITSWPHNTDYSAMRGELQALAVKMRTLVIGLSAQDSNIQDIFASAQARLPWKWPSNPRAHVFAENQLSSSQKNMLRCVYKSDYDNSPDLVEQGALFPAYGKPLLVALVLQVLSKKLVAYAANAVAHLGGSDFEKLRAGILVLRDRASTHADRDYFAFSQTLAGCVGRAISLLQEGRCASAREYKPVGAFPVDQIPADPHLATSGVQQAAVVLGLLGDGVATGAWGISIGPPGKAEDGAFRVEPAASRAVRIFFVANGSAAVVLQQDGTAPEDADDVVVVHTSERVSPASRSPMATFGRTGTPKARHVVVPDLIERSVGWDEMLTLFRRESSL
jgi:hypothetical protein